MPKTTLTLLVGLLALTLAACGDQATLPEQAGERDSLARIASPPFDRNG